MVSWKWKENVSSVKFKSESPFTKRKQVQKASLNSLNLKQLAEALENRKGSVVRARVRFFARTFVFVVLALVRLL